MKKVFLSLFAFFVCIISFCSADYSFTIHSTDIDGSVDQIVNVPIAGTGLTLYKISSSAVKLSVNFYCLNGDFKRKTISLTLPSFYVDSTSLCGSDGFTGFYINAYKLVGVYQFSMEGLFLPIGGNCPTCSECPTCDPQYTSDQCQSVYGLVSSGDLNTCFDNYNNCQSSLSSCQSNTSGFNDQLNNCNLSLNACNSSLTNCLQYNCPEVDYTGDLLRSNIYINNILHPGRQFVNIEIPDYIQWDYSVGDDDFNLYVGSGYDVDYIESVIDINSYRPTSEDFTNVFVSGLTLVMPYIVIALFIIFVRKLLKRIFK